MKRTLAAVVLLLPVLFASCEKDQFGRHNSPAMKVNVTGVVQTKAPVVTTSTLQTQGKFKMTCFATQPWQRDSVGTSKKYDAGIYVDPGSYSGSYDESQYPSPDGNKFRDIDVNYVNSLWMIAGNYDNSGNYLPDPKFSWVNDVTMRFFAYAPVTVNGDWDLTQKLDTDYGKTYHFDYKAYDAENNLVPWNKCDDIIFASSDHKATYGSVSGSSNFGQLINGTTDKFDLTFHHALSQIRFCLSTDDDTYDSSLKLVSVKILGPKNATDPTKYDGIYAKGHCVFTQPDTFAWTFQTTDYKAQYTQTFNASFVDGSGTAVTPTNWVAGTYSPSTGVTKNLYTCTGDVMFVIPQELAECKVAITFQQGTDAPFTLVGSLPVTDTIKNKVYWEPDKFYTYKIKASKSLELTLLPPDWIDGGGDIQL